MIHLLWPSTNNLNPRKPITLLAGEVEEYDFTDSAEQIYCILSVLHLCNLISRVPYKSADEVLEMVHALLEDIDFESDELQISEASHIRFEYRDEMLSLELYVGV